MSVSKPGPLLTEEDDDRRIWAGGLPFEICNESCEGRIGRIAGVECVRVRRGDKGPPFAFILMKTGEGALDVIEELNQKSWDSADSRYQHLIVKVQLEKDGIKKGARSHENWLTRFQDIEENEDTQRAPPGYYGKGKNGDLIAKGGGYDKGYEKGSQDYYSKGGSDKGWGKSSYEDHKGSSDYYKGGYKGHGKYDNSSSDRGGYVRRDHYERDYYDDRSDRNKAYYGKGHTQDHSYYSRGKGAESYYDQAMSPKGMRQGTPYGGKHDYSGGKYGSTKGGYRESSRERFKGAPPTKSYHESGYYEQSYKKGPPKGKSSYYDQEKEYHPRKRSFELEDDHGPRGGKNNSYSTQQDFSKKPERGPEKPWYEKVAAAINGNSPRRRARSRSRSLSSRSSSQEDQRRRKVSQPPQGPKTTIGTTKNIDLASRKSSKPADSSILTESRVSSQRKSARVQYKCTILNLPADMLKSELMQLGQNYVPDGLVESDAYEKNGSGVGVLVAEKEEQADLIVKKLNGKRIKGHETRLVVNKEIVSG